MPVLDKRNVDEINNMNKSAIQNGHFEYEYDSEHPLSQIAKISMA